MNAKRQTSNAERQTPNALDQPLEKIAWMPEAQRKLILRLGIQTWRQLLEHYPRRYEDRTQFAVFPIDGSEEPICLRGIVRKISARYFGGRNIMEVIVYDIVRGG